MTKTQEEFTKAVYETIKDKVFFSSNSEEMVEVVAELPKEFVPGKLLFDGLMLFDGIAGIEDDIQQMHSITNKCKIVNLKDYYTDNGAFDDDGWDQFIEALSNLMPVEKYKSLLKFAGYGTIDWGSGMTAEYKITRDGIMHLSGQLYDGIIKQTDIPFHHLVIGEGVKYIGQWNFSEWDQLEEVTIPSSVEEIAHAAFWKCKNLKRVNLSEGLIEIGSDAFGACELLENITLPKSLQEIGEYAFDGCPCEDEVIATKIFYTIYAPHHTVQVRRHTGQDGNT